MTRRLLAAVICLAGSALAQNQAIYTWVDADGEHFTDDRSAVPKGVKVRVTTGEQVSTIAVIPVPAAPVVAQPAPQPAAVPAGPSDEERWRTAFHDARNRVKDLEAEVETGRLQVEEINGLPVTPTAGCVSGFGPIHVAGGAVFRGGWYGDPCRANWRQERLREKLERDRRALVRAREDLADLERRAAFGAIPLEWRR